MDWNFRDAVFGISHALADMLALRILQDDDIIKTNRRCNMSKFKVGDKVRVTRLIDGSRDAAVGIKVGDVLEVRSIWSSERVYVTLNGKSYPMRISQIELVTGPKFKVGDKVKIVKGYPMTGRRKETDKAIGVVGKITKAEDPKPEAYSGAYGAYFYYVEGDNYEYDEDALELVEGAKVKDKDGKDNLRIVYKVVKAVAGGGFRSCRITDEKKLLYSLEHKTKAPKDAPLFVFSSWLHAKDFSEDGDVVLKCVGKVVDGDRFGYGAWIVPTDTLFCSWVFPIEVA